MFFTGDFIQPRHVENINIDNNIYIISNRAFVHFPSLSAQSMRNRLTSIQHHEHNLQSSLVLILKAFDHQFQPA